MSIITYVCELFGTTPGFLIFTVIVSIFAVWYITGRFVSKRLHSFKFRIITVTVLAFAMLWHGSPFATQSEVKKEIERAIDENPKLQGILDNLVEGQPVSIELLKEYKLIPEDWHPTPPPSETVKLHFDIDWYWYAYTVTIDNEPGKGDDQSSRKAMRTSLEKYVSTIKEPNIHYEISIKNKNIKYRNKGKEDGEKTLKQIFETVLGNQLQSYEDKEVSQ